jgi:DNA-binding transcriptional LysR family regulator
LPANFDLGISAFPFQRTALTAIPLNDGAVVVLPAEHHLVAKPVVQLSDLQHERLVLLSKTPQHPLSTAFQSANLHYVAETSLSTIACALVSEGLGIAVVDPFSASEFVGRNVVVRPLRPSFTIGTAIVYARERSLPLSAREFLDEFLVHIRSFLRENHFDLPAV